MSANKTRRASDQRKTNIAKRRRLAELYVRGRRVHFNASGWAVIDEKGSLLESSEDFAVGDDDITIWVTPPSPLQREQALRESQAERARAILDARKGQGPDGMEAAAFVAELGDDALIHYVLTIEEADRREEAQRDVLGREEWLDFPALQDAMRQWEEAGSPETDEWRDLLNRDAEFGREVSGRADELRAAAREALALLSRADVEKRALDRRVELVGSQAFLRRYEREMLLAACRDDDHHDQLFFDSVDDLMEQDELIQAGLMAALGTFVQEVREAKNSPGAASGSELSAPPVEPETSAASIPEAASA